MKVNRIGDHEWRLLEEYQNPIFPGLTILAGFEWDGASIPDVARSLMSNSDLGILEASASHDWLYAREGKLSDEVTLTRKQVDVIFKHEMKFYNVSWFDAQVAFVAVRAFGGSHWGSNE